MTRTETFGLAIMILSAGIASFAARAGAEDAPLPLMPVPAQARRAPGQLIIDPSFSLGIAGAKDPQLERAAVRFLDQLRAETGMLPLDMHLVETGKASLEVECERGGQGPAPTLGEDESYTLAIAPEGARLKAATRWGAMHGLETFLQLVEVTGQGFAVPTVLIEDRPRFPWRGLMIDVSRHFMPVEVLKRNLDGMAAVKMNVFHWHLSDDQGFRVESRKFPRLEEMGSDGMYYTQEQVREVIAYAGDRGIRVVPEFDMPGHATAWLVGYPELASAAGPYRIERRWGVFDPAIDPSSERTYKFLDQLIGEMAGLFPDPFFHIGGDEVNGKQWGANPKIQAFMRAHAIHDNAALQAYFTARVQKLVSKHHKTTVGWDEILAPGFPKDVVIQSWRGQASLAQAAKLGYRGLLSAGYYIDLMQSAAEHYAVDPMSGDAARLSPEESARILGGEATMWSEYVSPENIDSRIWPRTAAIAERLWSAPELTVDVDSMYRRLDPTSRRLEWLGLNFASSYPAMLSRIAGADGLPALKVLADVVEPVKGYEREQTSPVEPTSLMPLERLIDAARPESALAREFTRQVDILLAGKATPEIQEQIRQHLLEWRDHPAALGRTGSPSFLLEEVLPLSRSLGDAAGAGLAAFDYLARGELAPQAWKAEQIARLQQAEKPQAQLLLMVAPAIEKLVARSAGDPAPAAAAAPK